MPEIPTEIKRFLSHMEHYSGTELELLDLAEQTLERDVYRMLETFLEQGFARNYSRVGPERVLAREVYVQWCETFRRARICVLGGPGGTVAIDWSVKAADVGTLTPDQIQRLEDAKWRCTNTSSRISLLWTDDVENSIQEALDILGLPFHRGSIRPPPVRIRYERLVTNEDDFLV